MLQRFREQIRQRILAHKIRSLFLLLMILLLLVYLIALPRQLFREIPYSTVVTDRNGELIGARIADDGQWRFPPSGKVPEKFSAALITFEDRWFRWHPGINPVSVFRALRQNIEAGEIVSGGSTITMQLARLWRNKERTLWNKLTEALLATRLEIRYTKDEILALYAAHAPFGGNVAGLEAAAWRYFGRSPEDLSWGEAAMLAVLPNAPSYIHPGKNREKLLLKRNRLLMKLRDQGTIGEETCQLACDEPLPEAPRPLPDHAPHLCTHYHLEAHGKSSRSSIDLSLQKEAESVLERWGRSLSRKGIRDAAAVILDVHNGQLLAYCGNIGFTSGREGSQVDAAHSPRSTGSILKPFLYCALLQDGSLLPHTLIADIPVNINGFAPQNFDREFYGAVPADEALARSLNVPSVHMLRRYGVPRFYDLLKRSGLKTLDQPAGHYGLSLILGGAEGRLSEITGAYAALAARAMRYDWPDDEFPFTDRCAIWYTLESLKEVNRPDEIDWKTIPSIQKVAWKTGTSYGFRDGWAVGVTPNLAIGVWTGNASGEGVPGLTGSATAGPVLFDLFNALSPLCQRTPGTSEEWFPAPDEKEYITAEVCTASGHLKGPWCKESEIMILPKNALRSTSCPYHHPSLRKGEPIFQLPPSMEWFYRKHHPEYRSPQAEENGQQTGRSPMEFIYPENRSILYIPRQLDGSIRGVTFHLAHSHPEKTVFWHLDRQYVGQTRLVHQFGSGTLLTPGKHVVTVTDEDGCTCSVSFTVAEDNQP